MTSIIKISIIKDKYYKNGKYKISKLLNDSIQLNFVTKFVPKKGSKWMIYKVVNILLTKT